MATQNSLLDAAAINHAEGLGLQARLIVEGYMGGEHKSPFRGFAVEFTQHREYVHGDDLRHLDWKVLGRTDRYYLKQYEQETNYVAHLLLDGSESMAYGSGSITKMQYAKVLAASLAYLILLQRDAATVGVFDSEVRAHVPRTSNMGSIHHIMETLAKFKPSETTDVGRTLHELSGKITRKGIVILISDCFDNEDAILRGIQHIRFGGSEVILLHVMDPFELTFPFKGMVEFDGLERLPKLATRPSEIRKSYLAEVEAFRTRLREGCERNDCHSLLVNTSHPLSEVLTGYLAFRLKTLRR